MNHKFCGKIGVIIPTCGIRDYLWETIDSVHAAIEKCPSVQASVHVNAGIESEGIADTIRKKVGPWLSVTASPDQNIMPVAKNWNYCTKLINTPYIHILHDDDKISPYFYDAITDLIANHPDGSLYSTACLVFEEQISYYFKGPGVDGFWEDAATKLSTRNYFFCPGVVFARDYFKGFDESLKYTTDWKAWYNLANAGPTYHTSMALAYYRVHSESITASLAKSDKSFLEIRKTLADLQSEGRTVDYSFAEEFSFNIANDAAIKGDTSTVILHLLHANLNLRNFRKIIRILLVSFKTSLRKRLTALR